VAGLLTSALTIHADHLFMPLLVSLGMMAIGGALDSFSNNLTRPANMYLSQFLLAFGSTFFLGPTMALGVRNVVTNPRNLVSFSVMFGISQNLGSLAGAALLGTYQIVREKYHSSYIVERLVLDNPLVAARVQSGANAYLSSIPNAAARSLQGTSSLASAATREANIMGYNDVFALIAIIATLTLIWLSIRILWLKSTTRRAAAAATSTTTPGARTS
jgi:hypothetical protein